MFSINIKGKENPKSPEVVKLEMVFFKTGYPRVTKVILNSGPIKEWDAKTQQFIGRGVETAERNKRLLELKTKYLTVAEEWDAEGKSWAPVQWSHCFDTQNKKKESMKVVSLCKMFDILDDKIRNRERIKNGKVLTSFETARHYATFRKQLEEFTQTQYSRALSSLYFSDINEQFIDDFLFFMEKQGIKNGNGGNVYPKLRLLRGLMFYADQIGVADADYKLTMKVKPKYRPKKFEPKTIPLSLMRKIENIDRTLFTRIEQFHIDLFLFSFYTGGMANVDVCHLTWDCIDKDGRLSYERTKFPKRATMIFHPKARAIAEKYQDKCSSNYVLPIILDRHNCESKRRSRINKVRGKVNQTLGKIAKILKYKDKLTWYSARGTFISTMIAQNVPPAIVAEMSGNSEQTIFKHYFKNINPKEVDRQVLGII